MTSSTLIYSSERKIDRKDGGTSSSSNSSGFRTNSTSSSDRVEPNAKNQGKDICKRYQLLSPASPSKSTEC
ncbi:hypothetical protein PV325_010306 [Microctonus aethiopoides]|nr:hypothetical protein PV325_010306 [Microctonus aethiopoides]